MADKAAMLDRHLLRVGPTGQRPPTAADGFGSYSRYWVETLRLPSLSDRQVDRGFSFVHYDRIEAVRAQGKGPILVLPHLGGWEWAAAWLGRIAGVPVTAVVERLEPDDVFDWFEDLRRSWGVNVVPLGSDAFGLLTSAAKERHILCLLADRDIGGTGIDVEFFGEYTKLPVGPAVLSSRTGSPILPTAVYFSKWQRICRVGRPIWPDEASTEDPPGSVEGRGRARDRYRALTQLFAREMERLIADAPEQWHLLEPNWPSDHGSG
jgi:KDO2-lipid IV(A) lauroyltransferase